MIGKTESSNPKTHASLSTAQPLILLVCGALLTTGSQLNRNSLKMSIRARPFSAGKFLSRVGSNLKHLQSLQYLSRVLALFASLSFLSLSSLLTLCGSPVGILSALLGCTECPASARSVVLLLRRASCFWTELPSASVRVSCFYLLLSIHSVHFSFPEAFSLCPRVFPSRAITVKLHLPPQLSLCSVQASLFDSWSFCCFVSVCLFVFLTCHLSTVQGRPSGDGGFAYYFLFCFSSTWYNQSHIHACSIA